MKNERRKAVIAAYKERKVVAGIYAVRCNPTGERWLCAAPNIATVQNRIWFGLQMGTSPHRRLQTAWCEHAADFAFEEIERIPEEEDAYFRDRKLSNRLAHWCEALGARPLG